LPAFIKPKALVAKHDPLRRWRALRQYQGPHEKKLRLSDVKPFLEMKRLSRVNALCAGAQRSALGLSSDVRLWLDAAMRILAGKPVGSAY
jgi:hypothetical protein